MKDGFVIMVGDLALIPEPIFRQFWGALGEIVKARNRRTFLEPGVALKLWRCYG